jgi:hypothetical protein
MAGLASALLPDEPNPGGFMLNRRRVLSLVLILCAGSVVHAQRSAPRMLSTESPSASQLVILSASVDRASETLTINGLNFGPTAPQVFSEWKAMQVLSATDSKVVVRLPAATPEGTYLLTIARGSSPNDRDVFNMAVEAPNAVAGPMGPAGPVGPMGPAGPQGPQGLQGPQGPQGEAGAVGPKGDAGAVGPQGAAGPQGEVGPTGPSGPTGPMGPKGDTGAAGPMGDTGPAGPTGPKGDMGAAGAKGDPGPVGPDGPQGMVGPQGPEGPAGPQGPAGVSGVEVVFALNPALTAATVAGFGTFTGSVACPSGKYVIAGGYESLNNAGFLLPYASYPTSATTWRVMLRNTGSASVSNVQVRVYAVCATDSQ